MKRQINVLVSIVLISGLILSPLMIHVNANQNEVPSPRKQMAEGIKTKDVKCKSGLVLMIRLTNDAAACVKMTTSTKLSQAEWGEVVDLEIENKPTLNPLKQPPFSEEQKSKENVIQVKINDGIGSRDR